MFSLTNELVDSVEINGKLYDVNMSFDNILRLIDMLNDNELSDVVQIMTGIQLLFDESLDIPLQEQAEVFHQAFNALIGAKQDDEIEYDIMGNPMPNISSEPDEPVYDIGQDAEYIYASFMQCYGIDLFEQQGKMHYYKFRSLLAGLSEDTKFKKVIEIRQMELPSGKGSGKQRKAVEDLKRAYRLKPNK